MFHLFLCLFCVICRDVFALEVKYKEEFIFPLQWSDLTTGVERSDHRSGQICSLGWKDELSGIFSAEDGDKILACL